MKAISLWQPWAQLIAVHAKTIETRSWSTNYRGVLAIHAAKRLTSVTDKEAARVMLKALDPNASPLEPNDYFHSLPRGAIVAVVELYGCERVQIFSEAYPEWAQAEQYFGNFTPGRFCWLTKNPRSLKVPVECVGHQGFFNLPPDVETRVKEQL